MKTPRGMIEIGSIAITVLIAVFLGISSYQVQTDARLYDRLEKLNEATAADRERIAKVEVVGERMPYVEAKLDRLLESGGINPANVLPAKVPTQ